MTANSATRIGGNSLRCIGIGILSLLVSMPRSILAAPPEKSPPTLDYTIVVTGDELLAGVYADGHTLFITRTLRPLGLRCVNSISVADCADDIKRAVTFAGKSSGLTIVTGGLGPTETDITRDVLSETTGIRLAEHEDVITAMERRFGTSRNNLRQNLRRQARTPTNGTYLPNRAGTAVGLVFEGKESVIVALPGPPRELQPMVTAELVPYLARRFGTRAIGCSLTVRFVGIGQSQIDETLKQQVALPLDMIQSSQFENGRVDFTFALPGCTPADQDRLEQLRCAIHRCLDDYIYADDASTTLEMSVASTLDKAHLSIAIAEVGSGGGVAAGICRTGEGSRTLAGAFVAASEAGLCTLLGAEVEILPDRSQAKRMERLANLVAARTHGHWVVVTGEPCDVVAGGKRFSVALRSPDGTVRQRDFPWPGAGAADQAIMATRILDHLRRALR